MSRRLRQIEQAILARGTVDSQQLERLRGALSTNGPIDRPQADFLVELHTRLQHRTPAFEQFFFESIRAYILADSWIDAEQAGWLRRMLYADGKMGAEERKFLHELKNEVKLASREFEALLAESLSPLPEQSTNGQPQALCVHAALGHGITDTAKATDRLHPLEDPGKPVPVKAAQTCVLENSTMPYPARVIAFDLDAESLASLQAAFPSCAIEAVKGSSSASLLRYGSPGGADLLIVAAQSDWGETLGLCRELRSQPNQAHTPLLVLVPPAQEALVAAVLAAGAHSCLVLPVHTKDLVRVLSRALAGNRPGRHTLGLDRAQCPDAWRDEGGEG